MAHDSQDDIAIAVVSIILYGSLATTSTYYFFKFRNIIRAKNTLPIGDFGRYDEPKVVFFLALAIAAVLDIPLFVGCLVEGGPHDCEWDSISYPVFWCMHLLALCGYIVTIVIPPVLWSDIINQKDGKLWFSKYPMDATKWFFQISLFLFWSVMCVTVLLVILYYRVDDHTQFTAGGSMNAISSILEPTLTFIIALGCLYCGVQLQRYVMNVQLEGSKEIRFLFHLNVTLVIILATYLSRSVMVLRLFDGLGASYKDQFKVSYAVWILVTRWLPYILCSFCLINEMRFTGAQISNRYNRGTASQAARNSLAKSPSSSHHSHSLLFSSENVSLMSAVFGGGGGSSHGSRSLNYSASGSDQQRGALAQSLLSEGDEEETYLPRQSYSDMLGEEAGEGTEADYFYDEHDSYLMGGREPNSYDDHGRDIQDYLLASSADTTTQQLSSSSNSSRQYSGGSSPGIAMSPPTRSPMFSSGSTNVMVGGGFIGGGSGNYPSYDRNDRQTGSGRQQVVADAAETFRQVSTDSGPAHVDHFMPPQMSMSADGSPRAARSFMHSDDMQFRSDTAF